MTLITGYLKRPANLALAGDLMISTRGGGKGKNTALPALFDQPTRPFPSSFGGLLQKIVRLDTNFYAAWAGSVLVARSILSTVKEEVKNIRSGEDVLQLIYNSGFSKSELESVSFIFVSAKFDHSKNLNLFLQDYLCGMTELLDGTKVRYAGTGTYHFFDSISWTDEWINPEHLADSNNESYSGELFFNGVFARAALSYFSEWKGWANYDFAYGGAFEFVRLNRFGLEKIPYNILFWSRSGQEVSPINSITSLSYDKLDRLVIDQFMPPEAHQTYKRTIVGNFFTRDKKDDQSCEVDLEKPYSMNFVMDEGSSNSQSPLVLVRMGTPKDIAVVKRGEFEISVQLSDDLISAVQSAGYKM